ncbi:hypothetical protein HUJ05_011058 [Dendroctonus ponderosae]|nr:hypothetical protein HUJ05_011058 [Dendroctonus ponderosae]
MGRVYGASFQSPAPISDTPPITADISATGAGRAAIFSRIFLLTVPEPTQALIKPPKGPGGLNLAAWAAAPAEKFPGGFHPVSDNSDFISIQATEVGRDEGDLQSARSRISILTNKSHFNQSAMTIRCEASIYKIWKRSVESTIRDDSPKLAQVLGSTLSQSQKDPILGRRTLRGRFDMRLFDQAERQTGVFKPHCLRQILQTTISSCSSN